MHDDFFYTGDPRRCPKHGTVTSSPDGLHDAPCGHCEAEMDEAAMEPSPVKSPRASSKTPADITLRYSTIDRFSETRRFKTVEGARAYARRRIGTAYDISETFGYAVDMHGVGKLTAKGISLERLLANDDETWSWRETRRGEQELAAQREVETLDEYEDRIRSDPEM